MFHLSLEEIHLANPYHDKVGQFSTKQRAVMVVGRGGAPSGYLNEVDAGYINSGLSVKDIDPDYKRLKIDNKVTVYDDTDAFYKATGLSKPRGWMDYAAVSKRGDIHLSPDARPSVLNEFIDLDGVNYVHDIVAHEVLHTRPRVMKTKNGYAFADRSSQSDRETAWREEGLTQAMTILTSPNKYGQDDGLAGASYDGNMRVVMSVARNLGGGDYKRMAFVIDRMHKYNTKTLPDYIRTDLPKEIRARYGYSCNLAQVDAAANAMSYRSKDIWTVPDSSRFGVSKPYTGSIFGDNNNTMYNDLFKMKRDTDQLRSLSDMNEEQVKDEKPKKKRKPRQIWADHAKSEERIWKERGTIFID
jgi:hypothetical protein